MTAGAGATRTRPGLRLLKTHIPWQAKIGVKLVLGVLPVPHWLWKRLGVFEHSAPSPAHYVERVLRHREHLPAGDSFTVLELGPGDSVAGAMVMHAAGADQIWMVDVGRFATDDLQAYETADDELHRLGLGRIRPTRFSSMGEFLAACRATYLTEGLESLRQIPDSSVDLIWSHAVLEHVRDAEIAPLMRELRRIAKDKSVSSHAIDLKDHLDQSLHNLRFPHRLWEAMAWAGFYTNRLRRSDFMTVFAESGFDVVSEDTATWDTPPVGRHRLHPDFRGRSDHDLCVHELAVVLTPA